MPWGSLERQYKGSVGRTGASEVGTSCSQIHLHRGLGIDGHSIFPCLAGGVSDNETSFLTLKEKGERDRAVVG